MPLEIPNLDDRRWTDLVSDAVALIPRFAPAWTDHNVHDPGITFIELFAWLAEMQMYQVNRVGERHREVFARLAGLERRAPAAARVSIAVEGPPQTTVVLPMATVVEPVDASDLTFETTEKIQLTRSRIVMVQTSDATAPIDQTSANAAGQMTFPPFGDQAPVGASLRLRFDRFYPDDEKEMRLTFDVATDDLERPCDASPSAILTDPSVGRPAPPVDLVWEYRDGSVWRRATVAGDERTADGTHAFFQSGVVVLRTPRVAAGSEAWLRCRIAAGRFDVEPRLRSVKLNVLECRQTESRTGQRIGTGTGDPDQRFEITRDPIFDPARVVVRVSGEPWLRVDSFDRSLPGDKHYRLDPAGRGVTFGNGLNARVPRQGESIEADYVTSRGSAGNVAAGLRWRFRSQVVPGVVLTNPNPASGGAPRQSLPDLALEAQAMLGRPDRGVTLADLEYLARATPYAHVARAKAIANCPTAESITVVAMPKRRPGRRGPPMPPTPSFLEAVGSHLQRHRLLCDDVRVVGPAYVEVRVSARIRLEKGASARTVLEQARLALDRFFNGDLQAGDRRAPQAPEPIDSGAACGSRWPFGRPVFPSEVYAVLDSVDGVDFASNLALAGSRDGAPIASVPDTGSIHLPPTGLVFAGVHTLTVIEGMTS
jgi:baseplate J-like protein